MGLTIHYSLKATGSEARARQFVQALHQCAQDLPFQELGPVKQFSGTEGDADHRNDPLRWFLIQAETSVEIKPKGRKQTPDYTQWQRVRPLRGIGFTAWPGEGCEQSNFGLCQYPAVVQTINGPLRTKLSGWRWGSFCKTQYSSDPRCGGLPHFLQCHLTVIALLDKAKELGCLDEVHDEGGFWSQRNMQDLVRQIGSWNEMIAAFGGVMKDLVGEGIEMPISEFPDFEKLEAAGQAKLPPEIAQLAKLVQRVARSPGT